MQAGRLREVIELQRAERTRSATGDIVEVFKPYAVVRAEVLSQNSRRALAAGEQLYPTTRVFRLRLPPEVKGGDRIIHRGIVYLALPPAISPYEGVQTVTAEQVNE